ncbi:MAG: hypothetical protein ACI94Y_000501 [Maribacter sp.]|jgi:hypothetical protein
MQSFHYICRKRDTLEKTLSQYDASVAQCRDIFLKKTKDYGTAWRILRPTSLTDQLYIKAERIRSIEETGENKVGESIELEYVALVNYSVMAIIQLDLPRTAGLELPFGEVSSLYEKNISASRELMIRKNHDYGEAWRNMRISSITDLILQKLLRVKQIEDNNGKTIISEGLDANYMDIINYALFAMIKISEQ